MPGLTILIIGPIIGAVVACIVVFGLVASQNAGPDRNPAEQAALVYGE